MPEIVIKVRNKEATASVRSVVCDNTDYTLRFDFDEQWGEGDKLVYFALQGVGALAPAVMTGNTCSLPAVHLIDGVGRQLAVGVQQGTVKTSRAAYFWCFPSAESELLNSIVNDDNVTMTWLEWVNANVARLTAEGVRDYLTPEMFGAVDENGVVIIEKFNQMLAFAAANKLNVSLISDIELQFTEYQGTSDADRGEYYKNHPIRLMIEDADGFVFDGMGHTLRMTGLTREYQETVEDLSGVAWDFFVGLSLYGCRDVVIRNLNVKGEFVYYNHPRMVDGQIIPVDKMGYDTARAIGIALRGCRNVSITDCTFDGILGNGVNMKARKVETGSGAYATVWTQCATVTSCIFRNILEDAGDVMAGAQGIVYENCVFYNVKQGIETGEQNTLTNGNYNDGSAYAGDPYLYATAITGCWFQSCELGVISNSTDGISNCVFIETPFRVGKGSRSVWSNCIVRPNRPVSFYSRGQARLSNMKFLYPRIATGLLGKVTAPSENVSVTIDGQARTVTKLTLDDVSAMEAGVVFALYDKDDANRIVSQVTVHSVNRNAGTVTLTTVLPSALTSNTDGIYGYLYNTKYREYDYTHDRYWMPDLADNATDRISYIYATMTQAEHDAGHDGHLEFADCTFEFGERFQIWTTYRTLRFAGCIFEGGTLGNGEYTDITGNSAQSVYLSNTKINKIAGAAIYGYDPYLIPSGTDMNDLLDETKEYEYRGGTGSTVSNIPSGLSAEVPFKLFVYKLNHVSTRAVSQIILTAPSGAQGIPAIYQRVWQNTGWTAWTQLETTRNKVTEITRTPTDQQYPTAKAAKDAMDSLAAALVPANTAVSSWKTNKGIQWANGTESGFSNNRWRDTPPLAIPFGATRLIYSQVTLTDASSYYGLAFYKASYNDENTSTYAASYISGVSHLTGQSALGTRINAVDIPDNAAYVRITYGTASYNAAFDDTFYCAFVNAAGEILYDLLTTPAADGTYTLRATVSGGTVSYSWVAAT